MSLGAHPSPEKPTVLAVDDRRANLLAMEVLLADDYRLLFAGSGEEALATVQAGEPIDVILMDVQMPGMDGFEAAAAIKKTAAGKDIPIVFVTAVYNEDPYIKRGYAAGGIDYFGKPFDPEILKLKLRIYSSFHSREKLLRSRERHLKESEELLQVGRKLSSFLESLSVGVLIADLDGRICQTTEEVARLLGAVGPAAEDDYGEILGWWDCVGRTIRDESGLLARALREGTSSHNQPLSITCFDGSMRTVLASASPLHGLDRKLVGAVILIQDITEPRQLGEALERRVSGLIGLGVELEESAVSARR